MGTKVLAGKKWGVYVLVAVLSGGISVSLMAADNSESSERPKKTAAAPALATINNKPITKDQLYLEFIASYPAQANEALNRLVNEIIIADEAQAKKVDVTDAELKTRIAEIGVTGEISDSARRAIRTSMLVEKLIIAEKGIKVTPEEVKAFFDTNKVKLGQSEQVRVRQIFKASPQEMTDVILALNAGADFAKMAQAKSDDQATRDTGGDIGYIARGVLAPEIEKVVFGLNAGDISQVLQTANGGAIVLKVEEKIKAKEAKFDADMKKRIARIVTTEQIQKALPEWMDALRTKSDIKQ